MNRSIAALVLATGLALAAASVATATDAVYPGDDPMWGSQGAAHQQGCANGLSCDGTSHPPANSNAGSTNPGKK